MSLPQGIKGVSDVIRPQRAGRIRLGEKKISEKTGGEYPEKLDHFNFVDAPLAAEVYGDDCRELDILLPVNDKVQVLDMAYMRYAANGWRCRGDGEIAYNREHDLEIECAGEECQEFLAGSCKRQARFSFVLYRVPGGLSIYDIVTSGRRSIQNLASGLAMLESLFGQIDKIPLKLYLEPYETTFTGKDGKQHKSSAFCLRLEVAASLLEVKQLTLGRVEMPAPLLECADDLYPQPVQQAEALPPAQEWPQMLEQPVQAPDPSREPEPVEEGEDAATPLLDGLPKELREEIATGFEICATGLEEQRVLLERYHRQPQKLLGYLSARVDAINQ